MERLEIKRIKGRDYYYCSEWGWENGKCRRLRQRYIGSAEKIIELLKDKGCCRVQCAEVFQFGLPIALWNEAQAAQVVQLIDEQSQKRDRGLGVGTYLAIAAVNRAIEPVSKEAMWEWFSQTSLLRLLPSIKKGDLTSQQFWNNMDKMSPGDCAKIWEKIITGVIEREKIDLSSISYDGTNYYTFIDTFNVRCSMAKRGKNKQGRANLRQVNYSLFCTADAHVPLLYDVYDGNINDYARFPTILKRFQDFFQTLTHAEHLKEKTTLVFDKGNCSKDNFAEIDDSRFYFVTSTKLDEHPELVSILNNDSRFRKCSEDLDGTKAFRITKGIHGKQRTVIVTYNENLFETQWGTLQMDIDKALLKLQNLSQKLKGRENTGPSRGRKITQASIQKQCQEALSREYLKRIIKLNISTNPNGFLELEVKIDQIELKMVSETYLGKNLIVTNREGWTDDAIVRAYRSQYMIEDVFKESKDRRYGTWWPQFHWTDNKIHVHALYCTIALLLRSIMKRRVERAGVKISMKHLLSELNGIREVVNVYEEGKKKHFEKVLSKMSEPQAALLGILGLPMSL